MIKIALILLAFAPNAFARSAAVAVKMGPTAPVAAPVFLNTNIGGAGLGNASLPSLGSSLLPSILPVASALKPVAVAPVAAAAVAAPMAQAAPAAQARKEAPQPAARQSLAALSEAVKKTEKKGGDAAAPIARAYDGGGKRGQAAAGIETSAVSAVGRMAPRSFGLGRANFADAPKESVQPVAAPQIRREVEYAPINWRKAAAGFLLWLALVGLVVVEYGAIYYAISNAPAAQPSPEELEFQRYYNNGDFRDFGF